MKLPRLNTCDSPIPAIEHAQGPDGYCKLCEKMPAPHLFKSQWIYVALHMAGVQKMHRTTVKNETALEAD